MRLRTNCGKNHGGNNLSARQAKVDLTFAKADTRYLTHGLHPYPARMIPQVAKWLINHYALSLNDVVLDPYCGSGGVLVEARLNGINSIGVDINPLACLLARTKSTPINPKILEERTNDLLEDIEADLKKGIIVEVPSIQNLDFWFKENVSKDLALIRHHLFKIKEKDIRAFLSVCFSITVREASNTRGREFKLYRIPKDELEKYNPNAIELFKTHAQDAVARMKRYYDECDRKVYSHVLQGDTKKLSSIDPSILDRETATLVVTSPPYGDSRTTVAYGQFSRYSSLWLGFDKNSPLHSQHTMPKAFGLKPEELVMKVDNLCLGGQNAKEIHSVKSETFDDTINKIEREDEKRAREVTSYFVDSNECLKEMYKVLKKGKSYCCFVLGNRTVKRVKIPTDKILVELGKEIGFTHIKTLHRRIPTKRIPWENAPENITGAKGKTMSEENIIIWRV